jgi:hypothetical protein
MSQTEKTTAKKPAAPKAAAAPPEGTLNWTTVPASTGLKSAPLRNAQFEQMVVQAAAQNGVDPALIRAIILTEAPSLDPTATGDGGHSHGLAQIYDAANRGISTAQANNPEFAINYIAQRIAAFKKANPTASNAALLVQHNSPAAAQHLVNHPSDLAGAERLTGTGRYIADATSHLTGGGPTPSGAGGGTGGGTGSAGGAASTAPLSPMLTPDAGLSINKYGFIAALASNVPELKKLMEQYAGEDLSNGTVQARLQADIQNTQWFKTTTDKQRAAQVLKSTNPGEYQRQFKLISAQVASTAQQLGVSLPGLKMHDFAANALNLGWTNDEVNRYLIAQAKAASPQDVAAGKATPGVLQTSEQALREAAQKYLVPLSDTAYKQWSQDIALGKTTPQDFETYLKQQATSLYPTMANAIQRGQTVSQYIDPYRQIASQLLELPADSMDFAHDPKFNRAINQIDPKTQERTQMSLSDWQNYLRTLPEYNKTAGAMDQAAQAVDHITSTFGKVA